MRIRSSLAFLEGSFDQSAGVNTEKLTPEELW